MIAYLCRTCDHESLHDETLDDIAREDGTAGFCIECSDCRAELRVDLARTGIAQRTGRVHSESKS